MPRKSDRPRGQFVAVCQCGCGQPTLLAAQDSRGDGAKQGQPLRFMRGHQHRGGHNARWRGGRYQDADGYWWNHDPAHPNADARGYVAEHRKVMADHLGRALLPTAIVHHRDENPSNNALANLVLTDRPEHPTHHAGARWSRDSDSCADCGTTAYPHEAEGRCKRCYQRWRYANDPDYRERKQASNRRWKAVG